LIRKTIPVSDHNNKGSNIAMPRSWCIRFVFTCATTF
jgi:hypothetical protein